MNSPRLECAMPFFIVDDIHASVDFYHKTLGFDIRLLIPDEDPFFAIVRRDNVAFCLKQIADDIHPIPNPARHEWAIWDAYIYTPDPDLLYDEFVSRRVTIHQPLSDTDDGLRAFEIEDNNGYVLCFGCPLGGDPA